MILLMTRPVPANLRSAATFRAAGWTGPVLFSPTIATIPLPGTIPPDGLLVFTSATGVQMAAARADLRGRMAVAVGAATMQAATAAGAICRQAGGDVAALTALLIANPPGQPILHVRGVHVAGNLMQDLRANGLRASQVIVYDQRARPPTDATRAALAGTRTILLPLYSPRAAQIVRDWGPAAAPLRVGALSPAIASAWGGPVLVPDRPDADALAACLLIDPT